MTNNIENINNNNNITMNNNNTRQDEDGGNDNNNKNNSDEKWYKKITVEPTMFLYMFAFMLTMVVEQAFYLNRACVTNHGYSQEICDNLNKNVTLKKEVQITVSSFYQWYHISGHVVPIVLALFLGSWSDRRGRKLPLLFGLFGKLIYSSMMLVNVFQTSWPLEYVIYTAAIPGSLTGSDVAIFASAFAYISDVTSQKDRTLRVTILDVCYLSAMPIGVACGSYLFSHVVNRSYFIMFSINVSCLLLSIIYTLFCLKWMTNEKQQPITALNCMAIVPDFFDREHVVQSLRTMTKKRESHRRAYLWIFMIAMLFYTFQRDEKPLMFLYTQYKFHWNTEIYSTFKTIQSAAYNLMMLCGIPVMSTWLGWTDTRIAMWGAMAHAVARFFFAFAEVDWLLYVGALISSLGPIVGPVLRSLTSKVVPSSERGKVFALLSVCDNSVPLISGVLYSQIYNATIGSFPGIFYLTIVTQLIVFILMLCVHLSLKGKHLEAANPEPMELRKECQIKQTAVLIENALPQKIID